MSSPTIVSDPMDLSSSQDDGLRIASQSPQLPTHTSPSRRVSRKERRQPSITPRRFSRFFDTKRTGSMSSPSSRALKNIVNNRQETQSSPLKPPKFVRVQDQENELPSSPREFKRRKTNANGHNLDDDDKARLQTPTGSSISPFPDLKLHTNEENAGTNIIIELKQPLERIVPFENRGLSTRLLQRNLGTSRSRQPNLAYPVNDWRDETASFYSRPEDIHHSRSFTENRAAIPFSNAGLNTNSLVAIGDDEGYIRLVESEKNDHSFSQPYLAWRIHKNAIIDVALSDDDALLATASGDQSAKVTDMTTQTTISILSGHIATLKQVRFQPGANNKNILATSGRDGCVQIWDLRCKGDIGSVLDMQKVPGAATPNPCGNINSIVNAHEYSRVSQPGLNRDSPGRTGISVTAIQFLPPGQEHLLLTASEKDSIVKLWDIRALPAKRRGIQPISCTAPPPSHIGNRPFGVTSLNMSSDGSRFYTVCKDNTVYAYSTSHLVLGRAPELETTDNTKRAIQRPTQEGAGPLYGFQHPSFHVSTFYIKSAIRKARDGHTELLACGSNDGTPILFPTDERYLNTLANTGMRSGILSGQSSSRSFRSSPMPRSERLHSEMSLNGKGGSVSEDSIPIYTHGTALVRGHGMEVSALSWTSNGELICADDDWNVRCWREGEDARDLRMGGEGEGRRWRSGWADVGDDYDNEE